MLTYIYEEDLNCYCSVLVTNTKTQSAIATIDYCFIIKKIYMYSVFVLISEQVRKNRHIDATPSKTVNKFQPAEPSLIVGSL